MILELDNTRRDTFRKCPYRYNLVFNRGVKPRTGSTALRYGTVLHAAREGFYKHIKENGWARDGKALKQAITFAHNSWEKCNKEQNFYSDYRTFENLSVSFMSYVENFYADEGILKVLHTERAFKIEILPGVFFTGKIDMEVKLNGSNWVDELKTTSKDIGYTSKQQSRAFQFIGYTYAMEKLYPKEQKPEGILITYHHLSAYKSKKTGEYGTPKILFDRIPQFFTEQDTIDWMTSFINTTHHIKECLSLDVWPKQFDSCYLYGACPYLYLCEQRRAPGLENFADMYFITDPWNVLDTCEELVVIPLKEGK